MAMPSHALGALRGQQPWCIYNDESAFFPPTQAEEARAVSERYISKSDPYILWTSTPNVPGDLMDQLLQETPSIYTKILLPYTVGLGNMLTEEDIAKARKSPSFEREMNLKFGFGVSNVFKAEDLEKTFVEYDLNDYKQATCSLAIDTAYGLGDNNSKFAFVTVAIVNNRVRVYSADQYSKLSFADAEAIFKQKYRQFQPNVTIIDGSDPAFIKACKQFLNENPNYNEIEKAKWRWFKVLPFNFSTEGHAALGNLQSLVSKGLLQVHPKFKDLTIQMRSVVTKDNGDLDKSIGSFDLLDSLRMSTAGMST